jgi:DNA-binding beta-propeller fold protein YncE
MQTRFRWIPWWLSGLLAWAVAGLTPSAAGVYAQDTTGSGAHTASGSSTTQTPAAAPASPSAPVTTPTPATATNAPSASTNRATVATNAPAAGTNVVVSPPTFGRRTPPPRRLPLNRFAALTNRLAQATNAPAAETNLYQRRLYAGGKSTVHVYDIDAGHALLRSIELEGAGDIRGMVGSVPLGRLYLAGRGRNELLCFDLATESVLWRRPIGPQPGRMAITPDGRKVFVPCAGDGNWWVVNALTGEVLDRLAVGLGQPDRPSLSGGAGPHLTWCNRWGTRVYLSVLNVPHLFVVDAATHVLQEISAQFHQGVRAFAVTADESLAFVTVKDLLGFEVLDLRRGGIAHRVEARTPEARRRDVLRASGAPPRPAAEALSLHPDQKELWLADTSFGYVYVADVTRRPPQFVASIPLFEGPSDLPHPRWISFSLDGGLAYVDGAGAIDTTTRTLKDRFAVSDVVVEVDFWKGRPYAASTP